MQFIIDNWYLLALALASGTLLLAPNLRGAGRLAPNAAVHLINRQRAVVLDVGEPQEFAAAHANGAKNLPLGEFEKKLPATVKNKTLPLVLMCPQGTRAARAEVLARKLGYEKAQALAGGLRAWREAGLPVEKTSS